jgi:hypothetical protein
MVYLNAKNITNGYILEVLGAENVGTLMASWNILSSFGIFCRHLVYFVVIWYIFSCFGMLHQEKSGNLASYPIGR